MKKKKKIITENIFIMYTFVVDKFTFISFSSRLT